MSRQIIKLTLADHFQKFEEKWRKFDSPLASSAFHLRQVELEDADAIGGLDYISIAHGPEDEGQNETELIVEMRATLDGKYGKWISEASFLVEHAGEIVACLIVVLSDNHTFSDENAPPEPLPLVANAMTHPNHQGRGFQRELIHHTLNILLSMHFQQVFFAIHPENLASLGLLKAITK